MDIQNLGAGNISSVTTPNFAEKTANPARQSTGSFADYYTQRIEEEARAAEAQRQAEAKKAEATAAEHQALALELSDYLKKSPAQHLRDAVMKELGITEEELQAMPPAKRQAMEKEITERIRERLAATEKQRGQPGDELGQGLAIDPRITALDFGAPPAAVSQGSSASFFSSLFASLQTGQTTS